MDPEVLSMLPHQFALRLADWTVTPLAISCPVKVCGLPPPPQKKKPSFRNFVETYGNSRSSIVCQSSAALVRVSKKILEEKLS
jgi:hypothetical protein